MMSPKKLTYMERKLYGPWYVRAWYFFCEEVIPGLIMILLVLVGSIDDFPTEWLLFL